MHPPSLPQGVVPGHVALTRAGFVFQNSLCALAFTYIRHLLVFCCFALCSALFSSHSCKGCHLVTKPARGEWRRWLTFVEWVTVELEDVPSDANFGQKTSPGHSNFCFPRPRCSEAAVAPSSCSPQIVNENICKVMRGTWCSVVGPAASPTATRSYIQ